MTNKVKFTSQFGVARYPHISSPDSKGKYADNKYKTKLVFPINDSTMQMVASIKEAATQLGKTAKQYLPIEVDEDAGEIVLTTKSAYAPAIFDGKGNAAKGVQIGGGSVLRVMGNITPFDKGVTLQLNQVQIKELNGFGTCAFDQVEDGYEFDPSDVSLPASSMDAADTGTASNGAALDI